MMRYQYLLDPRRPQPRRIYNLDIAPIPAAFDLLYDAIVRPIDIGEQLKQFGWHEYAHQG